MTRTSIKVSLRHADAVSKELLSWFESAGRCFPWRLQRDPFAILIAEKLLQQTAARQVVIDAYRALLSRYPTAVDLATADVRILKKFIRPLGLAYRAQELRSMGRALVSEFDGRVPSELKDLLLLPGVGDYAARAVLSFAFDRDVPIVDTNFALSIPAFRDLSTIPSESRPKEELDRVGYSSNSGRKCQEIQLCDPRSLCSYMQTCSTTL